MSYLEEYELNPNVGLLLHDGLEVLGGRGTISKCDIERT